MKDKHPIILSDQKQVFIDGKFIDKSYGVSFEVHQPIKTNDITLRCDKPWEKNIIGLYNSVIYDDKIMKYKMWYGIVTDELPSDDAIAGRVSLIGYAESDDGIQWDKPLLGMDDGRFGVKTNIVMGAGASGVEYIEDSHIMVFIDPNAQESERYKLVTKIKKLNTELYLFASEDGIEWKEKKRGIIKYNFEVDEDGRQILSDKDANGNLINIRDFHLDSQNTIFWDDSIQKYVTYVRKNKRIDGQQYRTVARGESPDLDSFPLVDDMPVVLQPDAWDCPQKSERLNCDIAGYDIYTNAAIKYQAESAYYMFPSIYYKYGSFLHGFKEQVPMNSGPVDVGFAASRDGINWERYDRRPFISLGQRGQYDSASIYMVHGLVPGENGTMYMYSSATDNLHGYNRGDRHHDRNNRLLTQEAFPAEKNSFTITRYEIREDGFVSVYGGYTGGEFITPALIFSGNVMKINVDTSAAGTVAIEIQDEDGIPIRGLSAYDCDLIHTANQTDREVKWAGKSDLGKISGRTIKLRFVIKNAHIYSFKFTKI